MLIQDHRNYATNQLRTDGHTHSGASPFDNKSASGHLTARIHTLAIRQQTNKCFIVNQDAHIEQNNQ